MDTTALASLATKWAAVDPEPAYADALRALVEAADADGLRNVAGAPLTFGTAGLRGLVGPGPNHMNECTVWLATTAVALEMERQGLPKRAVIGFDGRIDSRRFASVASRAMRSRGIEVVMFDEPTPTPLVAYAIQKCDAGCGIVVTASHNPPEYNGYKLFWQHGSQITTPIDENVAAWMQKILDGHTLTSSADAGESIVSASIIDEYFEQLCAYCFSTGEERAAIAVAYSAMHGVGGQPVQRAFANAGIDVCVVESQFAPDGNFPTVKFPNPEEPGATDELIALAREQQVDIAIANDPDADRLAAIAPRDGVFTALTGDEVGVLLASHLLENGREGILATTIVSSAMLSHMAKAKKLPYANTLTGFKWIAAAARTLESETKKSFLFGYEEALGYSVGGVVRDKDGIGAALTFCDLVAQLKGRGQTVWDRLDELAQHYGVFVTKQVSIQFPGLEGAREMKALMDLIRSAPPQQIGDENVESVRDLLSDPDYPPSNVLVFSLRDVGRVIMRPSGTEPKLKCYYQAWAAVEGSVDAARQRATSRLDRLVAVHQELVTKS